jgi:PAS domain S-box-containing protein
MLACVSGRLSVQFYYAHISFNDFSTFPLAVGGFPMSNRSDKTILLVEDEALIALTEARMLQKYGYQVIAVYTGEEAVKAVAQNPEIDLILMDINLGRGIDGTQAAEMILAQRDLPLVFLSSHVEREVVEKTDGITSYGYIVKNSGETVLIASIKMAFRLFDARMKERAKEEALRESETRLHAISDNLPGGLVYQIDSGLDGQQRRFSYIGATVERLHEVTVTDALNDAEVIYGQLIPEDRQLVAVREAEAITKMETFRCEVRVRMPSGSLRWRFFASAPHWQTGHLLWDGIEIDITERKQAEEALRESQRVAHVGHWSWDTQTNQVEWSDEMKRIFGLDPDTFAGDLNIVITQAIHPDDREKVNTANQAVLTEQKPAPLEYRVVWPDQTVRTIWAVPGGKIVDSGGNILKLTGIVQDITERKQAEGALRRSEAKFRAVVENNNDGIFFSDAAGQVFYRSPSYQRINGYADNERLGRNVFEIIHTDDLEMVQRYWSQVVANPGVPIKGEYRSLHKDGGYRWFASTALNLLANPDVQGIVVTSRDITENKLMEETLRKGEEKYRTLFSEMFAGFALHEIVCDNQGNPVDYITLEVNKAFETHLGAAHDAVVGKRASEILPRSELDHWLGIFGPVALTGEPAHYEMYSPLNDKHFEGTAYCPEKGKFAVTFTELKQAEIALRDSEARYRLMTENTADVIWILDVDSQRFKYISPSVEKLRGYTVEEVMAQPISEVLTPESEKRVREMMDARVHQFLTDVPIPGYFVDEVDQPCKGGAIVHTEVTTSYVVNKQGHLEIIGVSRNITERKRIENALQQAFQENQALFKELQHRVKNSFSLITSMAELKESTCQGEEAKAALAETTARIRAMAKLYDLFYESETLTNVPLDEYCSRVVAAFQLPAHISFQQSYDSIIVPTKIAAPVGLILTELITNAIKYAFLQQESGVIVVSLKKKENTAVLCIEDNGIGIPEEFDIAGSNSVGLIIVQKLAEQIQGSVRIERSNGTRCTVEFPMAEESQ